MEWSDIKKVLKENPKADFRTPDVLVQVMDKDQVKVAGAWERGPHSGFGQYYLNHKAATDNDYVQFSFEKAARKGKYTAYFYYPKTTDNVSLVKMDVFSGVEKKPIDLNLEDVEIMGQTTSTWVKIGDFDFDFEKKPYVKIFSSKLDGTVAANAILLIPNE